MKISPSDLVQIIAKASYLSERCSIKFLPPDTVQELKPPIDDDRLKRWCEVVTRGNWEKFSKRLIWDGLNFTQASSLLHSLPAVDDRAFPKWAETLSEIVENAWVFANEKSIADPFLQTQLPFKEILLPAVFVARQKLLNCLDFLPKQLLSESAYLTLEFNLLYRLLNISGKTLEYEFVRSRPLGQNLLNLLRRSTTDSTQAKVQYDEFVEKLLQDGLLSFFQSYPVLARTIATAVDLWVEATADFLQRLKADADEIIRVFYPNCSQIVPTTPLRKVIEIKPSLSDPHNGGNTVIALTFECGLKLIYKPKTLGVEAAFTQFLEWCNRQGLPLEFKVLKVCDRQTHGWVEYVEHLPCENREAAQRFYQRSGMLLCLLYALRVVDCHRENLIANGEHLVLIDMESLMHQEVNLIADLQEATEADTTVNLQFADSVLRTGLLPRWEFGKNKRIAHDISALGSVEEPNAPISTNVPILNGVPLSPNDYLNEIVAGFEMMYRFLIEKREILLSDDSPLAALQNQRVRFIFRPTKVYWAILQKSFSPQCLRDGIDRSIELDILVRAFLIAPEKPNAWPIFHAEMQAMEQLDIPYFAAYPNSYDLTIGVGQPIERYFKAPSYQQVLTQLQNLDETDLGQQIEIIKGSFYARVVRKSITSKSGFPEQKIADISEINPLTNQELLAEAERIAIEIQQRAIWGNDGSVKWISFAYIPNVERFQLMPLPEDLYNGNCGIALFLAALDYVRGTCQFRELTLAALKSISKFLQTADFESNRRFVRCGIGGVTGLGSIIYALVKIGYFLGKTSFLEDALGIAKLITPELIAADKQFDPLGGSAGAILSLLVLHAATEETEVLEKAIIGGQHLLAHRVSINYAPKAWKVLGQKQYTGFSHGAAGIAYALLKLYAVTQNTDYLEAACEGIDYESSIFSPTAANWPDLRDFALQNGQPGFMVSWCHGAAGIGLARLGGLPIFRSDRIDRDIEIALQTTQKHTLHDVDCICCGNFGRIEMLLVAAIKLSRFELRTAAEKRAAWSVFRARQAGGYLFPNLPNPVFTPSFFQGTAGIGYEFLRLAHPETLPCVLLWE